MNLLLCRNDILTEDEGSEDKDVSKITREISGMDFSQ